MKRIVLFATAFVGLLLGWLLWSSPRAAGTVQAQEVCYGDCPTFDFHATRTVYEEDHTEYGDWGSWSSCSSTNFCSHSDEVAGRCQDNKCGNNPNRYERRYRTVTPNVCPAGYTYQEQSGPNDCYKVENFDLLGVQRNKSQDPNKCHKPTPDELSIPSWARPDYGSKVDEWVLPQVIACPSPIDCVWHWSECSEQCGGGIQTVIVDTPASNGGQECPTNTQSCNTQACSTIRWCFPNNANDSLEHPYYATAIPNTDKPETGFAWETGMDKWCEFTPEPTDNGDICKNIEGVQTSIPEGLHLDASGENCVEFGKPGVSESSDSGTGQVLGAVAGQVLGANSMAGTGTAEEALFNLIFTIGSLLSAFGIRKSFKITEK